MSGFNIDEKHIITESMCGVCHLHSLGIGESLNLSIFLSMYQDPLSLLYLWK